MLQTLESLDRDLLLALNGGHISYLDQLMWLVTHLLNWAVMLGALAVILWRKGWRNALIALAAIAIVVLIADQVSSHVIKPLVMRPRPTHEAELEGMVNVVNGYEGGRFGFVSSHAANHFGVALLLTLMFRNRLLGIALIAWAALVSYSRIYLGVHYPGDILGGTAVGLLTAWGVYVLWKKAMKRYRQDPLRAFNRTDARALTAATALNLAALTIWAAIAC